MPSCLRAHGPAIALIAGLALPACSLVSGWSDLQGGAARTSDAGKRLEDGAVDLQDAPTLDGPGAEGAAIPDAPGTDAATPPEAGVSCGSAVCVGGQGCCVDMGRPSRACTTMQACPASSNAFLLCNDSHQCADRSPALPLCCLDDATFRSTCVAGCGPATGTILCRMSDPSPCASPAICTQGFITGTFECR